MSKLLVSGGTIVTMNPRREILEGDILIEGNRIKAIGKVTERADRVIDASGKAVIPGLIQTHIHLCQTLFRGQADDLELMDWLKLRIWPLEAAHDEDSIYWSAMLGSAELMKGGTTCIVDMETVHHTEHAFRALKENGLRAVSGKVMMDWGNEIPEGLRETTQDSIDESVSLMKKWHGEAGGRLRYAFTPRFAVSCTDELLREVGRLAREHGVLVHTHASENRGEIELVQKERGMRNINYLESVGLTGEHVLIAHCIWLNDEEIEILARTGTRALHCPSSNLKLASGIARVTELREKGVHVSLGADGAPCNNNLDGFMELRLAALLQKVLRGPTALPAGEALALATIHGAEAIGLAEEIGSLEVGKKADLAVVDIGDLHCSPVEKVDPVSRLVYSARATDVVHTVIDGQVVMENRRLLTIDEEQVRAKCNSAAYRVLRKAGIAY